MINPADFKDDELQVALDQLRKFDADDAALSEQLQKYFAEFDSDHNEWLDRKELRQYLTTFFQ